MRAAVAIAWEIWTRHRLAFIGLALLLPAGMLITLRVHAGGANRELANAIAGVLTALALTTVFACFHFTEGSRKGGFGRFPERLVVLPIATSQSIGWPMIFAAAAAAMVYGACVRMLFWPRGIDLPVVLPTLFLICGVTHYQMIVWSLPESRYRKLICLAGAATAILVGWMFFLPQVLPGTLSELGYAGDPQSFLNRFMFLLALAGPAAYGISLWRVGEQRHGLTARAALTRRLWEATAERWQRRRRPFRCLRQAVMWQEWTRSGWILPFCTLAVLVLTCVPTWLAGPLDGPATRAALCWMGIAPILLAAIIGRGFGKPDFWSPSLKLSPFHAVLPVPPARWVEAKLATALGSATLTWGIVLYAACQWLAWVGDLGGPEPWLEGLRFYYSANERACLLICAPAVLILITWTFLVAGLPPALSGCRRRYAIANASWAALLGLTLVALIWRGDAQDHGLRLWKLWPWISALPWMLAPLAIAKFVASALAWNQAHRSKYTELPEIAVYGAAWALAVLIIAAFCYVLCRNTPWLWQLLILLAILALPLGGPVRSIVLLARSRTRP